MANIMICEKCFSPAEEISREVIDNPPRLETKYKCENPACNEVFFVWSELDENS